MLPSVAVVVFSFFCTSLIHAFNLLVLLKCCLHKKIKKERKNFLKKLKNKLAIIKIFKYTKYSEMFSSILIIILVAKGKRAAIFWAHNILKGFFHDLASIKH